MDPGPDVEAHHHHHHAGPRWLDMLLACSAILISAISLFVAVQHGRTMEKMVETTTWPFVDFGSSNGTATGERLITLVVQNTGVGPARVDSLELNYDGRPMRSAIDLLDTCCVRAGEPPAHYAISTVTGRVLPARELTNLLQEGVNQLTPVQLDRLNQALPKLQARICYCSVLDECWMRDSNQPRPEKVKLCPTPKVPY